MLLPSMNPVAPAAIQPIIKPTIILAFLRNGDPNNSVKRIARKEIAPIPMKAGLPHLKGLDD
jgi:hypothetical protein